MSPDGWSRSWRGEARCVWSSVMVSGARQIAPDLGGRRIEIGARRAQIAFGASDQALNGVVLPHRLETGRLLAARQLDGRIQRGARDADRERGKAQSEHHIGGELVERPLLAQRRGFVAQGREFLGDEQVVDRIAVGAGAVEADHVPDVVHRGIATGNRMVRTSGAPLGFNRRVPSASTIWTWAPSQLACREPLAKSQRAVAR